MRQFILLSAALLFFVAPYRAFAQAGKAELLGTILDPSGLPVPNGRVVAEQQGTMLRFPAVSDVRGEYHVLGLPAGEYVLIVEQEGFRSFRQSGITLRIAERVLRRRRILSDGA